jgi:hypothetical protein
MKSVKLLNHDDDSVTKMPAFNRIIQVEVDIDTVNRRLFELFPVDYKHREVLSHAIIGSAVEAGNISYIYNALNGYTNDIDFKEGDKVICESEGRYEWYNANKEGEDGTPVLGWIAPHPGDATYRPHWKKRGMPIGACTVRMVNLYAPDKLLVEFMSANYYQDGQYRPIEKWVNHKKCSRVA